MSISLAIKYRPTTFDDVVEQNSTTIILRQQLATNTFKHAYLFCGPAGCGKTTCARIFANEINKGKGNPIELDAASNNGVDDVREIIQQSKTQSLDSEYKIFIIDECHALSNSAWQAMLKIIEEPPAKSVFIFCTTNSERIPKTILSRVQRYDFQRISQSSIVDRLWYILEQEDNGDRFNSDIVWVKDAIEYIAKLADGGMRDAITMLDKCLSYSKDLTLENVVEALSTVDYDFMFHITDAITHCSPSVVVKDIEDIYNSGVDLKQFVKSYIQFILDAMKYELSVDMYVGIPLTKDNVAQLNSLCEVSYEKLVHFLDTLVKLNSELRYSETVKNDVLSTLLIETENFR